MSYLEKIRRYCAYQDRCHSEVRTKLLELSIYGTDLEDVISTLISEGFLNEERYARSYCRGKFNNKAWGRNKIIQGLKAKKVSDYCIKMGLTEIDDELYLKTFKKLFEQKENELSTERNIWIKKKKISSFLIQRGYESSLIYDSLSTIQ